MINYDVIVVGAGHAGCEAALASARMGMKTAIFTLNLDSVDHQYRSQESQNCIGFYHNGHS